MTTFKNFDIILQDIYKSKFGEKLMYIDIHCHMLYDTDDGPADKNEMLRMLQASYDDGVREICLTPHFNHSFYGNNKDKADKALSELTDEAQERFRDMKLYRGNEIFYHSSCFEYLKTGNCSAMNDTKYILVDFVQSENKHNIFSALKSFISHGYIPILAHTERYSNLIPFNGDYEYIKDLGTVIQVNAASVVGKGGFIQRFKARHLIKHNLCDVVASDSHNTTSRPTYMRQSAKFIQTRYGKTYVSKLMYDNPKSILNGTRI